MQLRRAFLGMATFPVLASLALVLGGAARTSEAGTILTFSQVGTDPILTATANGAQTQTTLSVVNALVTISGIDYSAGLSVPISAYLTLSATSQGAATAGGALGTDVRQSFTGNFSITSAINGGGENYLSGVFDDAVFGSGVNLTLAASQGNPGEDVTFTSSKITNLGPLRGMSLALSGVTPAASIVGTTLAGFTSSVSGNFSATPEPSTLALAGLALPLVGLGYLRRRRQA